MQECIVNAILEYLFENREIARFFSEKKHAAYGTQYQAKIVAQLVAHSQW